MLFTGAVVTKVPLAVGAAGRFRVEGADPALVGAWLPACDMWEWCRHKGLIPVRFTRYHQKKQFCRGHRSGVA